MHRLIRRPSPAMIVAIIALVFSVAGTATAARYIITSTKQIKPSVVKKLRGKTGPRGKIGQRGLAGVAGPKGDRGDQGAQGPAGPTSGGANYGSSKPMTTCTTNTLLTKEFSVSTPSRVFASGQYVFSNNGTATNGGVLRLQLLDSSGAVAASGQTVITYGNQVPLATSGILMAGTSVVGSQPYVANPGTYTLRLTGDLSSGTCGLTVYAETPGLSYVLLGNG